MAARWFVVTFFLPLIVLVAVRRQLAGEFEISISGVIAVTCSTIFYDVFFAHIQSLIATHVEMASAKSNAMHEPIVQDLAANTLSKTFCRVISKHRELGDCTS